MPIVFDGTTGLTTPGITLGSTAVTASANQINSSAEDVNAENLIINGDFGIWQRGTTSTIVGYGAADRWRQTYVGGTATQTQVPVSGGPALSGNNLVAWLRQTVSGQTLVSHFAATEQRIEDVRNYAGKTITILGWAKRNSGTGNMSVEVSQYFGTGGAPSATTSTGGTVVTLTTGFAPFAVTVTLSSLVAKTLGTDDNHSTIIRFWTSAGSDQSSPSGSLGLQTIAVDLWGIHIRVGTWAAADAALYRPRDPGTELALCQRYYQTGVLFMQGYSSGVNNLGMSSNLPVSMRTTPVVGLTASSNSGLTSGPNAQALTSGSVGMNAVFGSGTGVFLFANYTADAEL